MEVWLHKLCREKSLHNNTIWYTCIYVHVCRICGRAWATVADILYQIWFCCRREGGHGNCCKCMSTVHRASLRPCVGVGCFTRHPSAHIVDFIHWNYVILFFFKFNVYESNFRRHVHRQWVKHWTWTYNGVWLAPALMFRIDFSPPSHRLLPFTLIFYSSSNIHFIYIILYTHTVFFSLSLPDFSFH